MFAVLLAVLAAVETSAADGPDEAPLAGVCVVVEGAAVEAVAVDVPAAEGFARAAYAVRRPF